MSGERREWEDLSPEEQYELLRDARDLGVEVHPLSARKIDQERHPYRDALRGEMEE